MHLKLVMTIECFTGFTYGYDPVGCSSRDGISAKVIAGGSLVSEIVNATTIPPNYSK